MRGVIMGVMMAAAMALPAAMALSTALPASAQEAPPAAPAAETAAPLAGDPAAGEKVYNRCKACHQIGEGAANAVGPELNGVVGRPAGKLEGYAFSTGLAEADFTWDQAHLQEWLQGPKKMIPTTKMIFPGIKKEQDFANLLSYLEQFDKDGNRKTP